MNATGSSRRSPTCGDTSRGTPRPMSATRPTRPGSYTRLARGSASEVLGPDIAKALVRKRPATVQVIVPPYAEALAFLPLEIAHASGKPLAQHDVTLVIQTGDSSLTATPRCGDRLRLLGLFSLPEGGQPLNLRRERHALVKLISGIAANGKAAEVRVLQYGVTRDRLRDVLEEAEGWDIIHISGHGRPGELLLETADGHARPGQRRRTGRSARPGPRARQARDRLRVLVRGPHRRRTASPTAASPSPLSRPVPIERTSVPRPLDRLPPNSPDASAAPSWRCATRSTTSSRWPVRQAVRPARREGPAAGARRRR